MKLRNLISGIALVAGLFVLASCESKAAAPVASANPKVAFVYIGPPR
jgi:hypothetical protein